MEMLLLFSLSGAARHPKTQTYQDSSLDNIRVGEPFLKGEVVNISAPLASLCSSCSPLL